LLAELLRRQEEVRVVLSEAADARQPSDLAALLPAVDGAELGVPLRKVAVAPRLALVDLDVERAVDRLQHELLVLVRHHGVHAVGVRRHVARGAEQLGAGDVRSDDRLVAALDQLASDELLERAAELGSLRKPDRQTDADLGRHEEEAELAPYAPVIPLLRLLE